MVKEKTMAARKPRRTGVMTSLGLEEVNKLTVEECRSRVRYLKRRLHAGHIEQVELEGQLLADAKYYANWYAHWANKNAEV